MQFRLIITTYDDNFDYRLQIMNFIKQHHAVKSVIAEYDDNTEDNQPEAFDESLLRLIPKFLDR